jgi:hypothetical protein
LAAAVAEISKHKEHIKASFFFFVFSYRAIHYQLARRQSSLFLFSVADADGEFFERQNTLNAL